MTGPALQVDNLSYTYPDGSHALKGVSFSVEKGCKLFFHGANGAGKTTLFQCIVGLLPVKDGVIGLNGRPVKSEKERMRRVSIVFQNANDQLIAGSVFDEVAFGPLNLGLSDDEARNRVEQALVLLNISDLRDKPPHFLSYGQKKRVTIASILAMNQDMIILDEPTAGLDPKQAEELVGILDGLAKNGTTLLVSTHDAELSYRLADKVIVLDRGRLLAEGLPEQVFADNAVLSQASLNQPLLLEVFQHLKRGAFIPDSTGVPKSKAELFHILNIQGREAAKI